MTGSQGQQDAREGLMARLRRWFGRPLPDLPPVEAIEAVPEPPRPLTTDPEELREAWARVQHMELAARIRARQHPGQAPGACIPEGGG